MIKGMKSKYYYSGSVYEFNECVNQHWEGSTYAISEDKARSNLAYQYKRSHNKTSDTKISLPGKIRLVG